MLGWIRRLFGSNVDALDRKQPRFDQSRSVNRADPLLIKRPAPDENLEHIRHTQQHPTRAEEQRPQTVPGFVALDCETTGLSPDDGDRVISIGIIEVSDIIVHDDSSKNSPVSIQLTSLVFNPGRKSHWAARKKHGLSDRFLSFQPEFFEHATSIAEILKGRHVVGHNIDFDIRFLESEFSRLAPIKWEPAKVSCTMRLFAEHYPGERRSLDNACSVLDIDLSARGQTHHALTDALLAARAYVRLVSPLQIGGFKSHPTGFSNQRPVPPAKRGRPKKSIVPDVP